MTTIEQIRAEIEQIKPYDLPCDKRTPEHIRDMALDIIDKYAEQEPCDDAISREAVKKLFETDCAWDCGVCGACNDKDYHCGLLDELPSVKPQEQKTGKWEKIVKEHKCYARDDTYTTTEYHCSECGAEPFENEDGFYEFSNYCPNCGCRMVEPRESEDKE